VIKVFFHNKHYINFFENKIIFLCKNYEKENNFDLDDLKKIINIYYDEWLREAKKIHLFLSKNYFDKVGKYWWLTDTSRFIIKKTESEYSLKDYLYSRAIIKLIEDDKKNNFTIIGGNFSILTYVKNKLNRNYIVINNDITIKSNNLLLRILRLFIKNIFINIFYSIKLFAQIKFIKKIGKFKKFKKVIASLAINEKIIVERADHFFGNMFGKYNNECLWIYNDIPKSKNKILKYLIKNKRECIFAVDYGDLAKILFSYFAYLNFYFKIIFSYNTLKKQIDSKFWKYYYEEFFFNKLIYENIFYAIYLYKVNKKIFKHLKIQKIILPYEESGWQRSIILASQNYNYILYGYPHSSHNQVHDFYFCKDAIINPPRPDKILVTGQVAKIKFLNFSYSKNDIIIIGSEKFHKKNKISNFRKIIKPKILFICGYGSEIINFSKFIKNKKEFYSKYDLFIRENPHSWKAETKIAKKIFNSKSIDYKLSNLSFVDDVITSKYILFESSTAGLESILLGRLAMQINVTDDIFSDQFNDKNKKNFNYFMEFEDLEKGLNDFESFTEEEYDRYLNKQIIKVQSLIEKTNLENLAKI
jgi:hypothetical protein